MSRANRGRAWVCATAWTCDSLGAATAWFCDSLELRQRSLELLQPGSATADIGPTLEVGSRGCGNERREHRAVESVAVDSSRAIVNRAVDSAAVVLASSFPLVTDSTRFRGYSSFVALAGLLQ